MGRKERQINLKEAKRVYYVFCEGESEEAYIGLLRQIFRQNIKLIALKSKSNISQRFVDNTLNRYRMKPEDKVFLMFDLDVPDIFDKISTIKNCEMLLSNPCLEIWFILHFQNHNRLLRSDECVALLKSLVPNYRKGQITSKLSQQLTDRMDEATSRALKLNEYANPSSTIHRLISAIRES